MIATTYFETFLHALENNKDKQGVLGDEWVVFPPNPDYGYNSTPLNALTFATMGVDGVHYAILTEKGAVSDNSPVIQICPMDFSDLYQVLASSFLSYLSKGCGVPLQEMEVVFEEERIGKRVLVPLLKVHFDQQRLWGQTGSRNLDRFLDLIEQKPCRR
jgi:hypothetical protein